MDTSMQLMSVGMRKPMMIATERSAIVQSMLVGGDVTIHALSTAWRVDAESATEKRNETPKACIVNSYIYSI